MDLVRGIGRVGQIREVLRATEPFVVSANHQHIADMNIALTRQMPCYLNRDEANDLYVMLWLTPEQRETLLGILSSIKRGPKI